MHTLKTIKDAYNFISGHPCFWNISQNKRTLEYEVNYCNVNGFRHINIFPAMVNDEDFIDDNPKLNNKLQYWLETGYMDLYFREKNKIMYENITLCHDYRLDCSGYTFESAMIQMARNIKKHYGDYSIEYLGKTESDINKLISNSNKKKIKLKIKKDKEEVELILIGYKINYKTFAKKVFWLKEN